LQGVQGIKGTYTVYRQSTPPVSAVVGDYWVDEDDGITYVYYDDGNSSQWVEFGPNPQQINGVIGLAEQGTEIGYGVTLMDFRGTGVSSVAVSSGIGTINIIGTDISPVMMGMIF
jgi:hypothetical protein